MHRAASRHERTPRGVQQSERDRECRRAQEVKRDNRGHDERRGDPTAYLRCACRRAPTGRRWMRERSALTWVLAVSDFHVSLQWRAVRLRAERSDGIKLEIPCVTLCHCGRGAVTLVTAELISLLWRGAETVGAARTALAHRIDVELHLPADYHHAAYRRLRSPAYAETAQRRDVAGGAELLGRVADIQGLEDIAQLEAPATGVRARVRIVSPTIAIVCARDAATERGR